MKGTTSDQPLPANVEAERSILGAILLDNRAYREAAERLRPEDFSLDSHRRIYSGMTNLAESSRPIDMIMLIEELDRRKELQAIGDVAYVSSLLDGVPDRPSIDHYIAIVTEKALRRKIILASEETIDRACEGSESGEQVLAANEAAMRRLAGGRVGEARPARIRTYDQVPTLARLPVEEVNWIVEGMIPAGSVVLWAGDSGSFKTWLSLWLAKAVHDHRNFLGRNTTQLPILYLDRENPLPLIRERCSMLGIQSSEHFRVWGGWQSDPPPMIGDSRLTEIARTTRPLIIFDSFIRFHGSDENSATEMGRIMGEVRALANAGAVVVLQHHKPKAEGTQYRGSGDIKAGVDVAFAITYEKEEGTLRIQCFKNRFGEEPTITVKPQLENSEAFEVTQDRALRREHEAEETIHKIIEGQPGMNQTQIVQLGCLPLHRTRTILKRGDGTRWCTKQGQRGQLQYFPIMGDSSFSAFQPYSPEKLKSSAEGLGIIEGEL